MFVTFEYQGQHYVADLAQPIDLAIPLRSGAENPNCFWAPMPDFSPVVAGDFVGSTAQGGAVNFFNVRFNPHGNGTHTECVGHIAQERFSLRECLREHHFLAKIVSLFPRRAEEGDRVIFRDQLEEVFEKNESKSLIIRTLPNDDLKMRTNYSGANPPYLHHQAVEYLVEAGVEHLLLDLPSVDREADGGQLLAHRAFWQYPQAVRAHCSITEMVFVPNGVRDGLYWLNLQTAALELDASPSRPIIYPIQKI
jgi:kynurenine formamidase